LCDRPAKFFAFSAWYAYASCILQKLRCAWRAVAAGGGVALIAAALAGGPVI
jgi:hypothetical protein